MADSKIKITAETAQAELSLQTLGEKVASVDEKFLGLHEAIGTLGAALSVGLLTEMIKGSIEAADSMGKMAQKAGISVESLSQLSVAAKLSDVDTQELASGLGKLSKSMVEAQDPASKAAAAYQALGISVTDSQGKLKSGDDVLKEVADSFAGANDGAGKTAAAMAILGKAGANLIPMLNGGSEELNKFAELSDKLGLTLDSKTSKAAQEVKDRFEIMGMAAQGVGMTVMRDLLPTLESISEVMVDSATDSDNLARKSEALGWVLKELTEIGMKVAFAFENTGTKLGALAAMAVAAVHGEFAQVAEINKAMWEDAEVAEKAQIAKLEKLWADHAEKVDGSARESNTGKRDIQMGGVSAKDNGVDAAVLALQNQEYQKYMQLMGVLPEQIKVYELTMKGATAEQIKAAQAAADASMQYDEQIRLLKQADEAQKFTAKSAYDLEKARQATLAGMVDLRMQEQLRNADMLVGVERERAVGDLRLQMTMVNIRKQRDAQVAALDEKMRIDKQHNALTLDLEAQYQAQRLLLDADYSARMQDAADAAAQNRLKNEVSVANFSANIRAGDYGNAMTMAEQLTAGLASKSQAAFEINKAASLSSAIIKGYSAIVNAFEDGTKWGGIYGGAAEAAVAALMVAAQIQSITSTQFGGGSSISATPGGVPSLSTTVGSPAGTVDTQGAPVSTAAAPKQQINVTLVGSQFSYDQVVNEIIPLLNEANGNGADIHVITA